jgi:hypothetical protein
VFIHEAEMYRTHRISWRIQKASLKNPKERDSLVDLGIDGIIIIIIITTTTNSMKLFMEPVGSIPNSQELSTCSYP